MQVKLLAPGQWAAARGRLLAFCRRYGDSRLTAAAMRELRELTPEALAHPAHPAHAAAGPPPGRAATAAASSGVRTAAVAVAVDDGKLLGVAFAADAGERACLVAVHPDARGNGAGAALIKSLHSRWGRLVCSVAADNPASMQMCFRAGMKAVGMHAGPTGKPTLRFESEP